MSSNLNYFVNKFCTVIVQSINRNYNEEQNNAYFLGRVLIVTEEGVIIEHPSTKCRTFFNMKNIIAIAEEKVYLGSEKEIADMVKDLKTS
jgi:hypothetical protein